MPWSHHPPSCHCSLCRDSDGKQHPVLYSGILTIKPEQESREDKKPGSGQIIDPASFALAMVEAVHADPGCERKAMLFRLDDGSEFGREVRFQKFESGSRVLTLVLTEKTDDPQI